ncbi:MAG: DUF2184 domain-containing protein [Oscillospiraceae bacterium]|jgi:hypothetical protein|nr:DUF2184 domain-containing protein [Oscillospiraceae bacterium]
MKNVGTYDAGVAGQKGRPISMRDSAIRSGQAFLTSELAKRDTLIREPLNSTTYQRDIDIKVGGGWAKNINAMNIDFGVTGGSNDGVISAGGANGIPVVQANLEDDIYKAHIFNIALRVGWIDAQRENFAGRSLEDLLTDGIRIAYDKHMDANVYVGFARYGTSGLLNNPFVTAQNAATGDSGSTQFEGKTADEILADINSAIVAAWAASAYDRSAIPNHALMPYEQYSYIATQKVSPLAEKTILTFLEENNIARKNGSDLFIGATAYCKGTGAANTDRLVVYRNDRKFLGLDELVPLMRSMTSPNTDAFAYDTIYAANISEVEVFYTQPIAYRDGI